MRSCFVPAVVAALLSLTVFMPVVAVAGPPGDFSIGIGMVHPQGTFASYGDPGVNVSLRATFEVPKMPGLSAWGGFNVSVFSSETITTDVTLSGLTFPVDQTTSQDAVALHVGLQLGSSSRNAFFRPRAAVGVGVYYFSTTLSLTTETEIGEEETLESETLDSHTCLGWRGIVGADLYFQKGWGISFDLLYDHVFNLHRIDGDHESKQTSRYQGFSVGAVFQFGGEGSGD